MVQVAIIGGGLAGPVLALSLLKHGISSATHEVRPKTYESGGNIAVAPNAARVLDHIGVFGRLRTQGFSYEEIAFEGGAGEVLGKFLNGSQKWYNFLALRIHRHILRNELLRACDQRGIPIHYEKMLKRFVSETAVDATVEFEDGERVTAEFVVGCDGIHSKVRSHIQDVHPIFSGLMGIMGTVMDPELDSIDRTTRPHLPAMLFGANGSFAIMPASFDGQEIGYFATIEASDRSREEWDRLYNDKTELKKMLADRFLYSGSMWPDLVKELCDKTPPDTLTSWPFFSVPHLDSWKSSIGRVMVIGDAAHAIPPTGGQGAVMAFEDAETLAYTISRIYDVGLTDPSRDLRDVINDQLTKWQRHRQERIVKVIDFTTKNGTLRKSSPHFYEHAAKEWIIWAVFNLMGSKAGANWMYSYNAENVLSALSE